MSVSVCTDDQSESKVLQHLTAQPISLTSTAALLLQLVRVARCNTSVKTCPLPPLPPVTSFTCRAPLAPCAHAQLGDLPTHTDNADIRILIRSLYGVRRASWPDSPVTLPKKEATPLPTATESKAPNPLPQSTCCDLGSEGYEMGSCQDVTLKSCRVTFCHSLIWTVWLTHN